MKRFYYFLFATICSFVLFSCSKEECVEYSMLKISDSHGHAVSSLVGSGGCTDVNGKEGFTDTLHMDKDAYLSSITMKSLDLIKEYDTASWDAKTKPFTSYETNDYRIEKIDNRTYAVSVKPLTNVNRDYRLELNFEQTDLVGKKVKIDSPFVTPGNSWTYVVKY